MHECIVRMEMPLNCLECPMYDWNRQKLCCNAHFDLRPIPNGGVPKPDWCPIICQLPEGHGDLIDRKKLLRNKRHIFETTGGCFPKSEWFIKLDDVFRSKAIVQAERSET